MAKVTYRVVGSFCSQKCCNEEKLTMRMQSPCAVMCQIHMVLLLVGFQAFGELPATAQTEQSPATEEKAQDSEQAAQPETPVSVQPLVERTKAANRPYNYIALDYMSVPEGGDEEYTEVESAWQQIHTLQCQTGRLLFWTLLKVENPGESPYQYVTMRGYNSLDDAQREINWSNVRKTLKGKIDLDRLFERTEKSRKLLYTETYEIVAYEGSPQGDADLTRFGYWQPAAGREQEYVNAERELAAPHWKKIIEIDPSFKMWGLTRLVSSTASRKAHKYRIFHLLDTAQRPTDQEGRDKIREARRKVFAEAREKSPERVQVNWEALRKGVKSHQLRLLLRTDPEDSAVASEWKKLEGSWKHVYKNGSYRIKRITKNKEVLQWYDADGKLKGTNESPMRIEIKEGVSHFYVYHAQATYHSVYKVHDGKWYEQLRGVFRNTKSAPDKFLVYERTEE